MSYDVHPVADLFPMLADDELAELAEDIKTRGLLQPIVLDPDGRVLDGRNRLAACELAGVEPEFTTYEGDDPAGFAFAVNVARRHLRAGARHLLTEKARRLVGITKLQSEVQSARLAEAATVLDFAPDLEDAVLTGAVSLQSAAERARQRKREAAEIKAKKERLRKAAPDLADQVDDGRLDLDEALGALEVREHRARQEAEAARQAEEERRSAAEREARQREQERQESLERDRDRLRMVITGWPTMRNTILPDPDGAQATEIVAGLGETDRLAVIRILEELAE